jgi:hypothetical protein
MVSREKDAASERRMTSEEWEAALNQASRLDAYLARRKAFKDPPTPLDGLILFREARQYMLLNRSGRAITSLAYQVTEHDDLKRRLSGTKTFRIDELPASCYAHLGKADPRPQRGTAFTLTRVVWAEADAWSGERHLEAATPQSVGARLESLPLVKAKAIPVPLGPEA